ncbi:MAG: Na(+)/H(+) antiporter subunit B [Pseudomonadota bacterium]
MRMDVILRVTAKLFIPFILVFGLYVQLHGDFGPGGGFQAGVIIAAGVVLYAIIFGKEAATRVVPTWLVEALVPLGVLIFAGVGVYGIVTGGNYLDYNNLVHAPPTKDEAVHGQHWGVFLVEIGVLVTVTSTMIAIFYAFAGRGKE